MQWDEMSKSRILKSIIAFVIVLVENTWAERVSHALIIQEQYNDRPAKSSSNLERAEDCQKLYPYSNTEWAHVL